MVVGSELPLHQGRCHGVKRQTPDCQSVLVSIMLRSEQPRIALPLHPGKPQRGPIPTREEYHNFRQAQRARQQDTDTMSDARGGHQGDAEDVSEREVTSQDQSAAKRIRPSGIIYPAEELIRAGQIAADGSLQMAFPTTSPGGITQMVLDQMEVEQLIAAQQLINQAVSQRSGTTPPVDPAAAGTSRHPARSAPPKEGEPPAEPSQEGTTSDPIVLRTREKGKAPKHGRFHKPQE
jgi:hypothetical protein